MDYEQQAKATRKRVIKIIVGTVLGLFFLWLFFATIRTVDAGQVGVVKRFGQVTGRTLEPGIHVVVPIADSVVKLPTKKVTYETSPEFKQEGSEADYKDYPVDTNTADGQPVDISYTIRFSVDPTKADWIVQNIGTEDNLVEKIVKAESRVWARNVPRGYNAEVIYSGEGSIQIQDDIYNSISETFTANGLFLDFVGIREIAFDEQYVNAIKEKQEAAVRIETEKNKAEQAIHQKNARITQAEASAEEQRLQRETISPQILEKIWIEKWNGQLPTYMLGDDASTLLQLPQ